VQAQREGIFSPSRLQHVLKKSGMSRLNAFVDKNQLAESIENIEVENAVHIMQIHCFNYCFHYFLNLETVRLLLKLISR